MFSDAYFPCIDGVIRTVHNYESEICKSAYTCVVTPQGKGDFDESTLPYEIYRLNSVVTPFKEYCLSALGAEQVLGKFLASKPFELFHAHTPFATGACALRYGKKFGIPVVATFHSKYYDDIMNVTHSKAIADIVVKRVVRFYESADSVWSVSNGTADTLRSYGYKGDIFVIDNGTDYRYPDNPDELRAKAKSRFLPDSDKPVLLFVGHQIWHKNIKLVLDTAVLLKKSGFDFMLFIAGTGYNADEIKEYASEAGLDESNVRFTGEITDRDTLKGLYLMSDMFFFPSVYDNAPLVVREAASMRVPPLLIRGSNAAEKIEDGVNGYLCDNTPESAHARIVSAFSSREDIKKTGMNASVTVSVPWSEIMPLVKEKYLEVIREYKNKQ